MLILAITVLLMAASGIAVWFAALRWSAGQWVPQVDAAHIRTEVRRHPRLAAAAASRLDPASATGLALTAASVVVIVGIVGFGLLALMVRSNLGFARFDLAIARFAARHAGATSTTVLRIFTQLGGSLVLVPLAVVVAIVVARRHRFPPVFGFLFVTVGGQYLVVNLIKWIVDRARPDIDRLTGFSGPSFPSGHAAAAAAGFAAFALLLGLGRSSRVKAGFTALAVALAVGIAGTRVFLGVHWLTDVLGGLALGWAWFALASIAFGGRLLRFGAPAEQAERVVEAEVEGAERPPAGHRGHRSSGLDDGVRSGQS